MCYAISEVILFAVTHTSAIHFQLSGFVLALSAPSPNTLPTLLASNSSFLNSASFLSNRESLPLVESTQYFATALRDRCLHPCFLDGKTEAQRGAAAGLPPHSQ